MKTTLGILFWAGLAMGQGTYTCSGSTIDTSGTSSIVAATGISNFVMYQDTQVTPFTRGAELLPLYRAEEAAEKALLVAQEAYRKAYSARWNKQTEILKALGKPKGIITADRKYILEQK